MNPVYGVPEKIYPATLKIGMDWKRLHLTAEETDTGTYCISGK